MVSTRDLVVYFGAGHFIPGTVIGPTLRENANYILIDNDNPDCGFRKETTRKMLLSEMSQALKDKVNYFKMDATRCGIVSQSVSEVHMYNVLGDPTNRTPQEPFLEEALRIIKPDGSVFVGETITPQNYPLTWLLDFAEKRRIAVKPIIANVPATLRDDPLACNFTSEHIDFLVNNLSRAYDLSLANLDDVNEWFSYPHVHWFDMADLRRNFGSYVVKLTKA